jgi:hypothetical protein
MGRGNWCPSDTNGNTVTENLVYVDVIDLMNAPEDRDEAFYDDAWEQFREDLREALPKSFGKAEDQDTRAFCHSRDTSPPSFAQDHIAKVSKKVFDALAKYYHLSFRDGAWMSRPYPIQHKKSPAELQP